MIDNYHERKDEVLRIYDRYCALNWHFKKETLEKRAENIRDGKFNLLVAGEAKSGKSTFINAYLGAEILPMDVLQCTSALIEINYGEEKTLTALYADGSNEPLIKEGKNIRDFLQTHAAIQEEYRDIPVAAINNEILIKSRGNIKKSEVEDLIKAEWRGNQNPDDYRQLVWKYINEKKDSWGKIVTKITLTHPLSKDITDVTIIDSPGINALGEVGDVTEEFIKKADALILIKPLSGGAIESESFMQFLSGSARDRNKGALLLVLTRKAGIKEEDLYKLLNQAVKEYGVYEISKSHITAVDSKLELYYKLCDKMKEDEINNFLEKEKDNNALVLWYQSNKTKSDFFRKLAKDSGFYELKDMLEQFGRRAKSQQLYDFLKLIGEGYDNLTSGLEDDYASIEKSAGNPDELRLNIAKKKDEIETIRLKMNKGIQEIRDKYVIGDTARIKQCADEEFKKYEQSIQGVKTIDELKKKALEGLKRFNTFRRDLQNQIISDCDKKLGKLADDTTVSFESFTPVFTAEDLKRIEEETEKNAYERKNYEKNFCSSEYKYGPSYSQNKHILIVKENILKNIENTKLQMESTVKDDLKNLTNVYVKELAVNADQKKKEYDSLCEELKTAEEMREKMESIKQCLQTIKDNAAHLRGIQGGLDNVIKG